MYRCTCEINELSDMYEGFNLETREHTGCTDALKDGSRMADRQASNEACMQGWEDALSSEAACCDAVACPAKSTGKDSTGR